jgi:hypothetical protein
MFVRGFIRQKPLFSCNDYFKILFYAGLIGSLMPMKWQEKHASQLPPEDYKKKDKAN